MADGPLTSLAAYSVFVAELLDDPIVERSTVAVWSESPYTGVAVGEVIFSAGIRLRMREEIDFESASITAYGYEVYRGEETSILVRRTPHPQDAVLASTFPHHKHVPSDIKNNRIPAPAISFERPNLRVLVEEIKDLDPN